MALVITTCTNRKRKPIQGNLHASTLSPTDTSSLASEWVGRLGAAADRYPASTVYGGRGFQEAALSAGLLDARLLVVSAGLGLIYASDHIPAYACTVLMGVPDSIAARSTDRFSVPRWWAALCAISPYHRTFREVAADAGGLILAALSESYIDMVAADLASLPTAELGRLRIFTRTPLNRVVAELRPFVMPYDDRLDGVDSPIRGTRGDFASRALRHFVAHVVQNGGEGTVDEHADAVGRVLAGWALAERFERRRLEDAAMLDLVRKHWDAERGGTARLLRRFRDDLGIACEQGRFADLARQVRGERA